MIYQLTATLQDITPPIWRRFQVDSDCTFHQLHKILQIVMGWEEYHLYDFDFGNKVILLPDPTFAEDDRPEYNARRETIQKHLHLEGQNFIYRYDFGDDWRHKVVLEKILPANESQLPFCLDGERSCPPEDCGGCGGFEQILDILQQTKHPEYKETVAWLKKNYDPERFDRDGVNALLQKNAAALNPKQAKKQVQPKKTVKMTAAGLKKKLQSASQQELIQLLTECFAASKQAQQFLTVKLLGEEATIALFQSYEKKVRDEFFPERGFGKLRLAETEKLIKEFEKITASKRYTLELMLLFVEMGVNFTNTYGDIDERFYDRVEKMYENVVAILNEEEGYELFQEYEERITNVVENAEDIGWGFHDDLQQIKNSIRWL